MATNAAQTNNEYELPFGIVANNENPAPLPRPVAAPQAPIQAPPPRAPTSRGPPPPPPAPRPSLEGTVPPANAPPASAPPANAPQPIIRRAGPVPPPPPSRVNTTRRSAVVGATKGKPQTSSKLVVVTDAQGWVNQKIKHPLFYSVAPDGSYYSYPLDLAGKPQETSNVIQPAPFYRASVEQVQDAYKRQRMDYAVIDADDVYKRTREELTRLYREYKAASADRTIDPTEKIALRSELIAANNTHALAEKARSRRYGNTPFVEELEGSRRPFLHEMLPAEAIDKITPFRNTVYICRRSNFPVSHFYTDTLPIVEVPEPMPINNENPAPTTQQGGSKNLTHEQKEIIARKKISAWRTRKAGRF